MNRYDIIRALRAGNALSTKDAELVVKMFFDEIAKALARGHRVEIRGLCSFHVKKYKAYSGRNPKTGKKIDVTSKQLPVFKPGKELRERVDRF
jgi:integration host factor subunit beta